MNYKKKNEFLEQKRNKPDSASILKVPSCEVDELVNGSKELRTKGRYSQPAWRSGTHLGEQEVFSEDVLECGDHQTHLVLGASSDVFLSQACS